MQLPNNEERVTFALYRGSRASQRLLRSYMDEYLGITYPQLLVLRLLWERDGRSINGLCAPLDLDSGTISPLLRRMEHSGLIQRSRIDQDSRVVRIFLTEKGKALEARCEAMSQEMSGSLGFSEEEVAVLEKIVDRFIHP
ncbi:MarR family winged helix-turn-helix transcriptional regulator [Corynebacterium pelargi]|uniref:HTH-type transcriptional regulator SarZ n=1 Tax=Corynebacterium pelargi TaxID=1471400 RepID=A0A410W5Z4_9CORY|nr:MarR family transcriptional regulator [Corynebacterium pelargi]QAU51360.1 HTH-type transcriptional regulator MgrA [Corynebacterium pelargi]GGG81473.1 MarR family transcriptional regulator [Corynebacterium pelargi]